MVRKSLLSLRSLTLLSIAGSVLLVAACNPLREISNIQVTVTSESEVQGAGPFSGIFQDPISFNMSEQQEFENSDATRDNLESSSLRSFTLRIKDEEEGQDLSFLEKVEVHIDTDDEDRTLIAEYDEFTEGDVSVTFHVFDDKDLTPYFTAEEATIETTSEGSPPEETKTLEAEMVFDINYLL